MDNPEEFFNWYKEQKAKERDIAIMLDFLENSDDAIMDCKPISIENKKNIGGK